MIKAVLAWAQEKKEIVPYRIGGGKILGGHTITIDFTKWYVPIAVLMVPALGPLAIIFYGLKIGSLNVLLFVVTGLLFQKAVVMFSLWTGTAMALTAMLVWKSMAEKTDMPRLSLPLLVLQILLSLLAYYMSPPWLK